MLIKRINQHFASCALSALHFGSKKLTDEGLILGALCLEDLCGGDHGE